MIAHLTITLAITLTLNPHPHPGPNRNLTKGLEYTRLWTDRVIEEFYAQGDDEKTRGLPVATAMDRDKSSPNVEQTGFIKYLVVPLYQTLAKLVPLEPQLNNLQAMLDYYDARTSE